LFEDIEEKKILFEDIEEKNNVKDNEKTVLEKIAEII
jgi:hypothetical protein